MRNANLIVTALVGFLGGCGGGSGGGPTFTTSVPGEKPLGSLSNSELATLCGDFAKFAADPTNKVDTCRLSAIVETAFTAIFTTGATDSSLQMSCAQTYDQCLNPIVDGGAGSAEAGAASADAGAGTIDAGAGVSCMRPPANCTATVAEETACINDQTAQTHALASKVPACSSVTLASVAPTDGGTSTTTLTEPASCQLLQSKCSGLSDAAQTFVTQYCALVAPCCTKAGLTSECAAQATSAAEQGTYDATAGAACLAALSALQGAAFCGGLAVSTGSSTPWAVIPACAAVFPSAGATPAGQPCNQDSDCAPGPNGGAICTFTPGMNTLTQTTQTCQTLTGKLGDACFGAYAYGGTQDYTGPTGAICDQSQGAICDQQTLVCVAAGAVGTSCNSSDMCDPAGAYCDLPGGGFCVARLPLGATCTGTLLGECAGNATCNDTTKKCTALGGAGAACSPSAYPSHCLSGFCNNGSCTNPLSPLCQ
jgi:hypothetical protein